MQSQRLPSTAGDQLADVLGYSDSSSMFVDPAWRDPDVGPAPQQLSGVPSSSLSSLGMRTGFTGMGSQTMQHQTSSLGSGSAHMNGAPSANDPFSQLSLSRGPSGSRPQLQSGAAATSSMGPVSQASMQKAQTGQPTSFSLI